MLIHGLMERPMSGQSIEERSMGIIEALCPSHGFSRWEWILAKRLVHTTGDPRIVDDLHFGGPWFENGTAALRGRAPIVCDARMIKSGISLARLQAVHPGYTSSDVHCSVDAPEVHAQARAAGLPRSLFNVRALRELLNGAICCFGNAPVGLMELSRLIVEEGCRPAVVIAMPVGFVHVVESKRELMRLDVPYVAIDGRRGGSPLAVASLHAICLAAKGLAP